MLPRSDTPRRFRFDLIGTGRISEIYLKTCAGLPGIEMVACGSLDLDEDRVEAHGASRVAPPDEITPTRAKAVGST